MFSADDVYARIHQQPFRPVRIVTTTGQAYDVHHPELIMIGRRALEIGLPSADNPLHFEQVTRISLLHVTEMQDLPAAKSVSGNG